VALSNTASSSRLDALATEGPQLDRPGAGIAQQRAEMTAQTARRHHDQQPLRPEHTNQVAQQQVAGLVGLVEVIQQHHDRARRSRARQQLGQ
jgi:hypothetical protein